MAYPATNLFASYEPRLWGYSDGDVINNTTKKFLNDQGDALKDLTTIVGTPTYKTNICCGNIAVVRFDGLSSVARVGFGVIDGGSTIATVLIPRALTGFVHALPGSTVSPDKVRCALNLSPTAVTPAGRWGHVEWVFGSTNLQVAGSLPTIGQPYLVIVDSDASAAPRSIRLFEGSVVTASAALNAGELSDSGVTFDTYYVGEGRYGVGSAIVRAQVDIAAHFIYTGRMTDANRALLIDYLVTNYPCVNLANVNAATALIATTTDYLGASVTLNGQVEDRFPLCQPCNAR